MDLSQVTPLILTFNEKENIGRTVGALSWAQEVVILDSGSTDGTADIARSAHPNIRIVTRIFDNHTAQWNFGLDQVSTTWVLSLDADYLVSPEFVIEIKSLQPVENLSGYSAEFRYCIFGVPLRASVYPKRTVLFRRDASRYCDDGHTQLLRTTGAALPLKTKIDHDDRKPFSRWLKEQQRYAKIEARHLLKIKKEEVERRKERAARGKEQGATRNNQLTRQDRLRLKIFFAAPAMFLYLLFVRGLILDGWAGWYYVFQRTLAEFLLAIRLVVEKLKS
jgi:glycosyltransferase involved in cell wall biosynthesis